MIKQEYNISTNWNIPQIVAQLGVSYNRVAETNNKYSPRKIKRG